MKWTFPDTPYVPGALGWMTAAVPLDKDRQHDLKVEYFERDGGVAGTNLLYLRAICIISGAGCR